MCGATQSKAMLSLGVENPGAVRFATTGVTLELTAKSNTSVASVSLRRSKRVLNSLLLRSTDLHAELLNPQEMIE
ncbi:MAG: hypothetical protein KAG66_22845 [Methylococcales bacterium]|nr:hypothetical protein [Methylococcales bacterium]